MKRLWRWGLSRLAMGLELEAMGFESQADNGDKVLEWTTNLRQDTDR